MSEGLLKKRITEAYSKYYRGESAFGSKITDSIIDEAKKDIMNGIENHLEKLANHWKKEQVGTEGLEKLKQKCYVDAYLSVLHNHREHDAFKIKKWFGDST